MRQLALVLSILSLMAGALPECARADDRYTLPRTGEKVVLRGAERTALARALSGIEGTAPVSLGDEPAAAIMGMLPTRFRDSCREMAERPEVDLKGTSRWSVRVLFASRTTGRLDAVLALRCWFTYFAPGIGSDERPAVISLDRDSATVSVVPLGKDCEECHCDECMALYHELRFSRTLKMAGARLVELKAAYANDNPCCDGGDVVDGDQLVLVSLGSGSKALTLDVRTATYSHDDSVEDGEFETICRAKPVYGRDRAGNVESISAVTRCTENKKPAPTIRKQRYRWDADARLFREVTPLYP